MDNGQLPDVLAGCQRWLTAKRPIAHGAVGGPDAGYQGVGYQRGYQRKTVSRMGLWFAPAGAVGAGFQNSGFQRGFQGKPRCARTSPSFRSSTPAREFVDQYARARDNAARALARVFGTIRPRARQRRPRAHEPMTLNNLLQRPTTTASWSCWPRSLGPDALHPCCQADHHLVDDRELALATALNRRLGFCTGNPIGGLTH